MSADQTARPPQQSVPIRALKAYWKVLPHWQAINLLTNRGDM